jgi:hypothetical protein
VSPIERHVRREVEVPQRLFQVLLHLVRLREDILGDLAVELVQLVVVDDE